MFDYTYVRVYAVGQSMNVRGRVVVQILPPILPNEAHTRDGMSALVRLRMLAALAEPPTLIGTSVQPAAQPSVRPSEQIQPVEHAQASGQPASTSASILVQPAASYAKGVAQSYSVVGVIALIDVWLIKGVQYAVFDRWGVTSALGGIGVIGGIVGGVTVCVYVYAVYIVPWLSITPNAPNSHATPKDDVTSNEESRKAKKQS